MKNQHSTIFRLFMPLSTPEASLCFSPPQVLNLNPLACYTHHLHSQLLQLQASTGKGERSNATSFTTPFVIHPGTRALNQTCNTQGCNPQKKKQLPLQEIPPHLLLRPLFLTSFSFAFPWGWAHRDHMALSAHCYRRNSARTWKHTPRSQSKPMQPLLPRLSYWGRWQ